jgi:hypothetical protein
MRSGGPSQPCCLPRVARQALQLLLDRLGLRLAPRRHASVERRPHGRPPVHRGRATRRQARRPAPPSRPAPPGRPGPGDVGLPGPAAPSDVRSPGIASVPPRGRASAGGALARADRPRNDRRDQLSRRRVRRTRQNLSFAIRPSSRTTAGSNAERGRRSASGASGRRGGRWPGWRRWRCCQGTGARRAGQRRAGPARLRPPGLRRGGLTRPERSGSLSADLSS